VAVSFIGGGNPEYPEKITDLMHVTDKSLHYTTTESALGLPRAPVLMQLSLTPKP
jgi:hypothetical protein